MISAPLSRSGYFLTTGGTEMYDAEGQRRSRKPQHAAPQKFRENNRKGNITINIKRTS